MSSRDRTVDQAETPHDSTRQAQAAGARRRRRIRTALGRTLLYLFLGGFALLMVFPFIYMAASALKTPEDTLRYPPKVLPRQADEFTCSKCFLVHHRSQLAGEKDGLPICKDCAA